MEGRIRQRTRTHHKGRRISTPTVEYFFTYKHKLTNRKGSLELEMKMTKHDFELAWNEEKHIHLTKTRVVIATDPNEDWEIDFFKCNGETYFVLAECELRSYRAPKYMPDIVMANLLYTVPDNDPRFKNKELSNPNKTKHLLQLIMKETIDGKIIQPNAAVSL